MDILDLARRNQQKAWKIIEDTKIIPTWESAFFRERGLFLHSGKFLLLFGEGLTGFGPNRRRYQAGSLFRPRFVC